MSIRLDILQKLLRKQAGSAKRAMKDSLATDIWMPETGITAKNLQEQKLKHPSEVIVKDFTPKIENRLTGADWLWIFDDGTNVFGIAVQAKRQNHTGRYDICYRPKKAKGKKKAEMQIRTLIRFAKRAYSEPMYCFYNHTVPANAGATVGYNVIPTTDPAWGCSLAGAFAIAPFTTKKKYIPNTPDSKAGRLMPFAIPWHEILSTGPTANPFSLPAQKSPPPNWVIPIKNMARSLNHFDPPENNEDDEAKGQKYLREVIKLIDAGDEKKLLRKLGDRPPRQVTVVQQAANKEPTQLKGLKPRRKRS